MKEERGTRGERGGRRVCEGRWRYSHYSHELLPSCLQHAEEWVIADGYIHFPSKQAAAEGIQTEQVRRSSPLSLSSSSTDEEWQVIERTLLYAQQLEDIV